MNDNIKRGLQMSSRVWPLLSVGSNAAGLLIQQLNARNGGDETKALQELVRDFNQIDDMARDRGFPLPHAHNVFEEFSAHPETHLGFDESTVRRMRKIQAAFMSYQLVPLPAYPQKIGWKFLWIQPWGTASKKRNGRILMQWVYLAVIHDLAVDGQLRLVRECDFCQRWFFGRKNDQRFCSPNCREKEWRTSPRGRMKRAGYMRRYRQREELANQNALRVAKDVKREGRHSYRK
jgi:hypothetical protein